MLKQRKEINSYHMLFDIFFPIEEVEKQYQESLVLLKDAPK